MVPRERAQCTSKHPWGQIVLSLGLFLRHIFLLHLAKPTPTLPLGFNFAVSVSGSLPLSFPDSGSFLCVPLMSWDHLKWCSEYGLCCLSLQVTAISSLSNLKHFWIIVYYQISAEIYPHWTRLSKWRTQSRNQWFSSFFSRALNFSAVTSINSLVHIFFYALTWTDTHSSFIHKLHYILCILLQLFLFFYNMSWNSFHVLYSLKMLHQIPEEGVLAIVG